MQARTPNLLTRDDTFFGVCQALGEDFGFHPNLLRLCFAVPLMFAPMLALQAYFGLGAIVLVSRLLAPRPRRAAAARPDEAADIVAIEARPIEQAVLAQTNADRYALSLAA